MELMFGFCTVPDVVTWADSAVASDPNPDFELLELATCAKLPPEEVCGLLSRVQGDVDGVQVSRQMLGKLHRSLAEDPTRGELIARRLYALAIRGLLPEGEFGPEPTYLEDIFDDARHGIPGTLANANLELEAYLAKHSLKPGTSAT